MSSTRNSQNVLSAVKPVLAAIALTAFAAPAMASDAEGYRSIPAAAGAEVLVVSAVATDIATINVGIEDNNPVEVEPIAVPVPVSDEFLDQEL